MPWGIAVFSNSASITHSVELLLVIALQLTVEKWLLRGYAMFLGAVSEVGILASFILSKE